MKRSRRIAAVVLMIMLTVAALAAPYRAKVQPSSVKVYSETNSKKSLGTLKQGTTVTVLSVSGEKALINYQGKSGVMEASKLTKLDENVVTGSVVTAKATRVYKSASASSQSVKIARNVTLDMIGTKGSYTIVMRAGIVGYIPTKDVRKAAVETTPTPEPKIVDADGYTQVTSVSAVNSAKIKLYKKPDLSGSYVILAKGFTMQLTGVKDSKYARVESGGLVRYTLLSGLKQTTQATATPAPTKAADKSLFGSDMTNEQIIYHFLIEVCGYNKAAACGICANIRYESDFRPGDVGDSGTSYGIAQWHSGRKSALISWCKSNGYDYTTLKGQCYYLKYDLEHNYSSVDKYLRNVSNNAQGAYDAGYYYCYHFECPANRSSKSVTRGNYAKNVEWPKLAQ